MKRFKAFGAKIRARIARELDTMPDDTLEENIARMKHNNLRTHELWADYPQGNLPQREQPGTAAGEE